MKYRLICAHNINLEQDLHIIDWENGFACRFEISDTGVRQQS